jgi:hypothetical protein
MKKDFFPFYLLLLTSCNYQSGQKSDNPNEVELKTQPEIIVTIPSETDKGKIEGLYGGCGYNTTPDETTINIYQPGPREISQINSILKFSGLASNFKIYAANIDNAVATIINNNRYILYDPRLLSYTDQQSGGYWPSMSILAHEIGHHLSGHTLTNKGSNHQDELEADKFSGFILYKLGASLTQATQAIQSLGTETASLTHPSKADRLIAITKGWNEANETRFSSAVPPPPNDYIPTDGSAVIEFTKEMLWSQNDLNNFLSDNPSNGNGEYYIVEGIIIDVKYEHEGRVSGIVIYDPKDKSKNFINIEDPINGDKMCRACLGWFHEILKPGRRINYSIYYGGASSEFSYLSYLKIKPD